jgi:uncharacterized membrane protein
LTSINPGQGGIGNFDSKFKDMKKDNLSLMRMAKESLTGKWGLAIGTFLVYNLIMGALNALDNRAGLISLLIAGPLMLGAATFSLHIARGQEAKLEQLFEGFKYYGLALGTHLLMVLYIFLWSLLLIVPGIIAALSYSMTFYILADDKSMKPQAILDKSKQMMDGHKLQLFYLCLRFFLLGLLCILTLGIGFLWLIPYANVTMADFYDEIRLNHQPLGFDDKKQHSFATE